MIFCVIEKRNHNSFFSKKCKEELLPAVETTRSQLQDLLVLSFFAQNSYNLSIEKKIIKAETKKIPNTVVDLTGKSSFPYVKIWIYKISLEKHILNS